MKKTILLIALFMVMSFAFSADANLVAYYNNSTESHACAPASPLCAYNQIVKISSDFSGVCGQLGAAKILALSDSTDAHVDAGTNPTPNFTGNDICMSANTFTGGYCYFTWSASCDASAGYNCMFGLSDTTNAHISACNVFSPEYKFCCKFPNVLQNCPVMNLTTDKTDYNLGETIRFNYNCPAGNIDVNILVDANNYLRADTNKCGPTQKSFEINSSSLDMGTYNPKTFTAQLFTKDASCRSGRTNFTVTTPIPGGVVTPVERCKIKSITADPLKLDSNSLVDVSIGIKYDCYNNGVNETIIIFDPNGNIINTNSAIICNTAAQTYSAFQINSASAEGVYRARIYDANCTKDAFFAVTKSSASSSASNVADTNLIPIIMLLSLVVIVIFIKPKTKQKRV